MAGVDDIVRNEVQQLMATSKEYREKIDDAKTKTKKDWYLKKLKKNNTRLLNVLVAIEKVRKAKESPNEPE